VVVVAIVVVVVVVVLVVELEVEPDVEPLVELEVESWLIPNGSDASPVRPAPSSPHAAATSSRVTAINNGLIFMGAPSHGSADNRLYRSVRAAA
jgi:hypothetical protein